MADPPDGTEPRGATRRTSTPDPSLVGGYLDLREVGRGGFGVVYRAMQVEFNRTVALKILANAFDDDSARARFERECLAMGSLSGHPNIVTVYAAGYTTDGRPYIAMEFLPGGTLAERLAGRGIPWPEAIAIGIDGKRALWRALATARPSDLPQSDYRRLEGRAADQRDRIETARLEAARVALRDEDHSNVV